MPIRLRETLRYFARFNVGYLLVLAVLSLTLIGMVVLTSAGHGLATDPYYYFKKQITWLGVALVAGAVAAVVDLEKLRKLAFPIFGLSVVVLILVLIPGIGTSVKGAQRWIDLGPFNLQVSDPARLAIVFCLAHYLAANQRQIETFKRGYLIPMGMLGLLCFLIVLQPDLGTTALCGAVGFGMLFLAGVRWLYLVPTVAMGMAAFAGAVYIDMVYLHGNRLRRILAFLDPEGNKLGDFYQAWQGMLAFVAGGVYGVGLGNGRQQHNFLPEAHTDFIFPIIGEEMGLVFSGAVVLLFFGIFVCCFNALRKAPNLFQFLIVAGSLLFITLQALINMGVVTGMLPTKGMSLPFISYGGSNLVVMFVLVGLIINCFRTWAEPPLKRTREI